MRAIIRGRRPAGWLMALAVPCIGLAGGPARAQCSGQVSSTAAGATITQAGCISTSAADTSGILSSGAGTTITNAGTIDTTGQNSPGIQSSGDNAVITNTGTITTLGRSGHGVRSDGADAVIVNRGTIVTRGQNGPALRSGGARATLTNAGVIATSGIGAHGIRSEADGDTITNSGTMTVSGNGVRAFNAQATIRNSGTIVVTEAQYRGVWASGAGNVIENTGSITTAGGLGHGIWLEGAGGSILNAGSILAQGADAAGLYVSGSGTGVVNRGSVVAGAQGILVEAPGVTILNLGSVAPGAGRAGIEVRGAGGVVALTNAQGGATPLSYSGALPAAYRVVVRSVSDFGRLSVSNATGSMAFGVEEGSALSVARYRDVLTGVPAAALANEETRFEAGRHAWMLTAGATADSWDLLAWLRGPDAANTRAALQASAGAVRGVLAQRAAVTIDALELDCAAFDQSGACVSVGLRGTPGGAGEGAALVTAAFRLAPDWRLGAVLDQPFAAGSQGGVTPRNTAPMVGAFLVHQRSAEAVGLTLRAAVAYRQGELRITRPQLPETEPGTGRARASSIAFGLEAAYGLPVAEGWIAQPHLGLRHSDSRRQGYAEGAAENVEYPIRHAAFGLRATTATAGVRLRGAVSPRLSVMAGAGAEYDLRAEADRAEGGSDIAGLESYSVDPGRHGNRLRAVGSAGLRHAVAANQAVMAQLSLRQPMAGNDAAASVTLRYAIGF
jgi:hypothetical protein